MDLGSIDTQLCIDFAEHRREKKLEEFTAKAKAKAEADGDKFNPEKDVPDPEDLLSGRTLDLNVQAIEKVLKWAHGKKWLKKVPEIDWDSLADDPKDVRLLTGEELDKLCTVNLVTEESLLTMPEPARRLRRLQAPRARLFSDYLRLIFLTGAREHEMLMQRWTNVTWSNGERGHLHFPGVHAKAGGGKMALDRNVDFHAKLEAHLKDMFSRRNPDSDWMFPSFYDPTQPAKSFRKQMLSAREACAAELRAAKVLDTDNWWLKVAFHHGRHFFISWAVASGVDFKTIAYWVSHRNIYLIVRKYAHLVPGQTKAAAAKLDAAF